MDPLATSFLFRQFLDQRRYLKNVTPSTIEWYETAFKALQRSLGTEPTLTRSSLQQFVVSLRQRNVKPVSCNTYIKASGVVFGADDAGTFFAADSMTG